MANYFALANVGLLSFAGRENWGNYTKATGDDFLRTYNKNAPRQREGRSRVGLSRRWNRRGPQQRLATQFVQPWKFASRVRESVRNFNNDAYARKFHYLDQQARGMLEIQESIDTPKIWWGAQKPRRKFRRFGGSKAPSPITYHIEPR